jgi:hypothetical protein
MLRGGQLEARQGDAGEQLVCSRAFVLDQAGLELGDIRATATVTSANLAEVVSPLPFVRVPNTPGLGLEVATAGRCTQPVEARECRGLLRQRPRVAA